MTTHLPLIPVAFAAMLTGVGFGASTAPTQAELFSGFTKTYPGDYKRYEAAIDLDFDGIRDLIGWWYREDGKIRVHQEHSAGVPGQIYLSASTFVTGTFSTAEASEPHATTAGDLDGDGRGDMVAAIGDEIFVMVAQSGGGTNSFGRLTPRPSVQILPPHDAAARDVLAADFDGDGQDEICIAFPDEVRLYRALSNGALQLGSVVPVPAGGFWQRTPSMEVGDFDGDPGLELAVYHPDLNRVSMYSPQGHDLGVPEITRTTLGGELTQLAAGDIDGDGDDDLVVFREDVALSPPAFEVLRHGGQGQCIPEAPLVGGPASDLVDVDGDGDLDGVCCGGGGGGGPSQPKNDSPSMFRVTINDGTGNFSVASTHAGVGAHRLAAAFDLDGDGDIDLVSGTGMLLNQGAVGAEYGTFLANSTGQPGRLRADGQTNGVDAPITLTATGMPPGALRLLAFGSPDPFGGMALGGGRLCISPTQLQRSHVGITDASGSSVIDLTTGGIASLPFMTMPEAGVTVGFQMWHRDLASHGGSNLTEALAITLGAE